MPLPRRTIFDSPNNYGMRKPEITRDQASSVLRATVPDLRDELALYFYEVCSCKLRPKQVEESKERLFRDLSLTSLIVWHPTEATCT